MQTRPRTDIRPAATVQELAQDVEELRASHVSLSREVTRVTDELLNTRRLIATQALNSKSNFDLRIMRRLIMFANISAVQSLVSGSSELSRLSENVCAANAVRQVLLKSQATQCTLLEFQLLASDFSRRSSIQCTILPSYYYVAFPSVEKAKRFEIVFSTYSDFCRALEIDVLQSETGLYREKRGLSRDVRAVQVLGTDLVSPNGTSGSDRRILVGCSYPRPGAEVPDVPTLYQRSTKWTDGAFEYGFEYKKERPTNLRECAEPPERDIESSKYNSDINLPSQEKRVFAIRWERCWKCPGIPENSPEFVPGYIQSFVPAVILRTRALTSAAQRIFSERIGTKFLKQIAVSPSQQQ